MCMEAAGTLRGQLRDKLNRLGHSSSYVEKGGRWAAEAAGNAMEGREGVSDGFE
jgi:hypothetical protein